MRLWAILFLALVLPLHARVVRVQVDSRSDTFHGAYERITGRVYFSLPVANPHNQRIVDLANAVNLKDGEVEFSSDFIAVRPKNGNGSMILEVPNRGNARILQLVDGDDDWLLRQGFYRRERGLAVGCTSTRSSSLLCAHRQRPRQEHHRPAAR